jgi:hypothetical protein
MFGFDILFNVIPVKGSSTNVNGGGIFSGTDTGAMDNLVGVTCEELVSHGVANILGETNHIT